MECMQSRCARQKWQKICEDWAQSGLSARAYCEQAKIALPDFYEWRKRINFPIPQNNEAIRIQQKWWKICEDWKESGLSARKYCQEKNITRNVFAYWREKIDFPFVKKPKTVPRNWDEIIKDWEQSGLNIKEYCEQKNISSKGLCKRRYRIGHSSYVSAKETAHKWQAIIKDWETSGLTAGAYALEHQLNPSSIGRWDRKLNPHKPRKTDKALQKWTKIMEEWQTSGWSGFTYCRRKGIEVSCFYKWQKRLNVAELSKPHLNFTKQDIPDICLEDYFISIPFSSAISMGSPASSRKIEAVLPQGHQLSIEGQCDKEKLNAWLALLLQSKNDSTQEL